MRKGFLVLKDGTIFEGNILGYKKEVQGEVVFNTGMVGYEKSLTDPSYYGQILVFTYPLIGNYGIFSENFESNKIQVRGIIASEICNLPSHSGLKETLENWCFKERIPILTSIDTRLLTEKLRKYGTLLGGIFFNAKNNVQFEDINKKNLLDFVTEKKIKIIEPINFKKTVLVYDCGVKYSIIKELLKRNLRVIKVPWNFDLENLKEKIDGILISNGPGDPKKADKLIKNVKKIIKNKIPILGICLGHQILSLAFGAKSYKMKFGHRGQNQPVIDLKTKKCYITSQNHGYCIKENSLPSELKPWFKNLNDNTCEGIFHKKLPIIGVQFHPEGNPGPTDTTWVFDLFLDYINFYGKN